MKIEDNKIVIKKTIDNEKYNIRKNIKRIYCKRVD